MRRVLADPSFGVAAERLGATIREDAAGDALVRELEDVPAERRSTGCAG